MKHDWNKHKNYFLLIDSLTILKDFNLKGRRKRREVVQIEIRGKENYVLGKY